MDLLKLIVEMLTVVFQYGRNSGKKMYLSYLEQFAIKFFSLYFF